jgi:uncharacterized protein YbjT (DUF2867 family)
VLVEKTILVIGATGMLGEPVARRLKEDGFPVRIMARDVGRVRALFGTPFEVVGGEVTDPKSIEKALEGCYGVHVNLSGAVEQIGVEAVARVAKKQKIKRISYISGTSVAEDTTWFPQTKQKFLAEQAIRESQVPYCIFCPTWFMESLPKFVKGEKAFVFGKQPNLYHFIAAEDYSRMVSASYQSEKATQRRLFLHGPKGYLFRDALREYCAAFHAEIADVSTMPFWLSTTVATLTKKAEMKSTSDLMRFFERVGERGNPAEANQLLGAPQIDVQEWIARKKEQHLSREH